MAEARRRAQLGLRVRADATAGGRVERGDVSYAHRQLESVLATEVQVKLC